MTRSPIRHLGAAPAAVAWAALFLAGVAAGLAPTAAFAQSAQTDLTDRGQVYLFRQVSEALVCQCGCMMILHVCNHHNCPSATPIRKEIETMIRDGKSKDEILAHFVGQYGEKILSSPGTSGFNLAAWVAPFVMLLFGGVFVLSFLGARKRRSAALAARVASEAGAASAGHARARHGRGAAPRPAGSDDYASRVDDEIREMGD